MTSVGCHVVLECVPIVSEAMIKSGENEEGSGVHQTDEDPERLLEMS